jgi:CHAD domain-containing protein
LKAFAKVLGDVRDIDVLIQDQERQTAEADEERCDSLENITKWLEKERDAARKTLLETLDSERYERFQEYFAAMLRDGTDGEGHASKSAAALGRNAISTARDKCLKTSKRLGEDSPPEAYHDLRKRGKQLRYALEFLSSVYGVKKSAKLVKPLKEAQDTLGDQQDSIVATKLLRSLAEGSRRINRATVFEMGASSGRQAQEANEARLNFMQSGGFETFLKGSTWKDFDKDMRNTIKKARK